MSRDTIRSPPRRVSLSGETLDGHDNRLRDPLARCETLELVRTLNTIEKPIVKKRLLEMVKSIATTLSDE